MTGRLLSTSVRARLWERMPIRARVSTRYLQSTDTPYTHSWLTVDGDLDGELDLTVEDPRVARDLAAALTWLADRIEAQQADGGLQDDALEFGPGAPGGVS